MSWTLGIDTSSAELSLGLLKDGEPFLSCSRYARNSHAEHITRAMNFLLESSGIEPPDINYVGIAVGPGSFTGLRIGVSFLKGFFLDSDTPVLPISSLHSMAESFNNSYGPITAIMDARQDRIFCAKFKRDKNSLERITDDEVISLKSSSKVFNKNEAILLDTLGYRNSSVPNFFREKQNVYLADRITLQRGIACSNIAAGFINNTDVWKKSMDILPNYMQASYAEMKANKKRVDTCNTKK